MLLVGWQTDRAPFISSAVRIFEILNIIE